MIGLNDSGGARIQEGVLSLAGYADIFLRNTLASGVIPQISAIMGPCAGGAVYSPALTDFIFMVEQHQPHVRHRAGRHQDRHARRRDQRKAGRRDDAQLHQRRGAFYRAGRRRVPAHDPRADDATCRRTIATMRRAQHCADPIDRQDAELDTLVPADSNLPYDIKDIIHRVVDRRRVLRSARALGEEHRGRICAHGRAERRHRGQPAGVSGGLPGHQFVGEGRALRALLRRVQYSDPHV